MYVGRKKRIVTLGKSLRDVGTPVSNCPRASEFEFGFWVLILRFGFWFRLSGSEVGLRFSVKHKISDTN